MKILNKFKGELVLAVSLLVFALIMSPVLDKPLWTIAPFIVGGAVGLYIINAKDKKGPSQKK